MAPAAQDGKLGYDDEREHDEIERRLVEADEAVQSYKGRERQSDGAYEAEYGKAEDRCRCKRPAKHDVTPVDVRRWLLLDCGAARTAGIASA